MLQYLKLLQTDQFKFKLQNRLSAARLSDQKCFSLCDSGLSEAAMVEEYMTTQQILYPTNENRIRFMSAADDCPEIVTPTVNHKTTNSAATTGLLLGATSQLKPLYCLITSMIVTILK